MLTKQFFGRLAALSLLALLLPAQSQVKVYDPARKLVTIPSVSVGAAPLCPYVFTLQSATAPP